MEWHAKHLYAGQNTQQTQLSNQALGFQWSKLVGGFFF